MRTCAIMMIWQTCYLHHLDLTGNKLIKQCSLIYGRSAVGVQAMYGKFAVGVPALSRIANH